MAKILPELSEEQILQIKSTAEAKVYRKFRDELNDNWNVLYSVSWITSPHNKFTSDGETDFILFSSNSGILVIEVKGGGIQYDSKGDSWMSIDRDRNKNLIKNPFEQARNAKYSILKKLKEKKEWIDNKSGKINIAHAVFFPDLNDKSALISPDRPADIIGCYEDLKDINSWILNVLNLWDNTDERYSSLGPSRTRILIDTFARNFEVEPLITARIDAENKVRVQLTMQQARIIRFLGSRRRVAISGGAGTGKTLLALEKAKELANDGFSTLVLCYNRPLSKYLELNCQHHINITVSTFHHFCHYYIAKANLSKGQDFFIQAERDYPNKDKYDVQLPYALGLAIDSIEEKYDAIIIDEGQDFRSEYWLPIEMLLKDYDLSPLYVFYDCNQALYKTTYNFPFEKDHEYSLNINCRNTSAIHKIAYKYYQGKPVDPPSIKGVDVKLYNITSPHKQCNKIKEILINLICNHEVKAEDIAILIVDNRKKEYFQNLLKEIHLPKGAVWSFSAFPDDSDMTNKLRSDSVHRFKGLEVEIVILWGFENFDIEKMDEVFYVGLSRATSELHIVGEEKYIRH